MSVSQTKMFFLNKNIQVVEKKSQYNYSDLKDIGKCTTQSVEMININSRLMSVKKWNSNMNYYGNSRKASKNVTMISKV